MPNLSLVIGGAASGKSGFAERLVVGASKHRHYIATAQSFDDEMAEKIERHKHMRADAGWSTIEEPIALADALGAIPKEGAVLIDCATLWLTNLMLSDSDIDGEIDSFLIALKQNNRPVVIVTNEVGGGIVPEHRLGRQFRQAQGELNQQLAAEAQLVVNVIAGLPQVLKGQLPEFIK